MVLMIMLQMVNHLNIKQLGKKIVGKTQERPERSGNEGDADRPTRPPAPALNVEVTIPLKCLSNFWRFLDLPLINCEIELDLS